MDITVKQVSGRFVAEVRLNGHTTASAEDLTDFGALARLKQTLLADPASDPQAVELVAQKIGMLHEAARF